MLSKDNNTFLQIPSYLESSPKFNWNEKAVISLFLSFNRNEQSITCTNEYICKRLSISDKTLKRILKKLEQLGIISRKIEYKKPSSFEWFLSPKYTKRREILIDEYALQRVTVYVTL